MFFLLIFFTFIFSIIKYYFSEPNVIFTNKSRTLYLTAEVNVINNLPLLQNDTNDVITYIDDLEDFKNKRKKRIWEKLISDKNE